jgi:hypothetical protein
MKFDVEIGCKRYLVILQGLLFISQQLQTNQPRKTSRLSHKFNIDKICTQLGNSFQKQNNSVQFIYWYASQQLKFNCRKMPKKENDINTEDLIHAMQIRINLTYAI